jgi:hypothetical protein
VRRLSRDDLVAGVVVLDDLSTSTRSNLDHLNVELVEGRILAASIVRTYRGFLARLPALISPGVRGRSLAPSRTPQRSPGRVNSSGRPCRNEADAGHA